MKSQSLADFIMKRLRNGYLKTLKDKSSIWDLYTDEFCLRFKSWHDSYFTQGLAH